MKLKLNTDFVRILKRSWLQAYFILGIINVLIFVIPALFLPENIQGLITFLGSVKGFRLGFLPYQLLTAPFLHAGWFHLISNMLALFYSIGPDTNKIFGNKRFLGIYFFSAICGGLLSAAFLNNPFGSVGASGALMGLVGALAAFAYYTKSQRVLNSIIVVVILNFYLGFSIPGIDNFGHLGGLIGGFIAGYFFIWQSRKGKTFVYREF